MLTQISLYLWGAKLDPQRITEILGVMPSAARAKGETRTLPTKHVVTAKIGVWEFCTYPELKSSVLADHIELLQSRFGSSGTNVGNLPNVEDACVDVFMAISAKEDSTECDFELSQKDLSHLQQFSVRIEFHVAFTDSDFINSSS